jgi:hypothetical protein
MELYKATGEDIEKLLKERKKIQITERTEKHVSSSACMEV